MASISSGWVWLAMSQPAWSMQVQHSIAFVLTAVKAVRSQLVIVLNLTAVVSPYTGKSVHEAASFVVKKFGSFHEPRVGQPDAYPAAIKRQGVSNSNAGPVIHDTLTIEPPSLESNEFTGGLIAVDAQGRFAFPFNSLGMYRGVVSSQLSARVYIWREEESEDLQLQKVLVEPDTAVVPALSSAVPLPSSGPAA